MLEAVVIAIVLSGLGRIHDVPYTGAREVDLVGAGLSALGMGGLVIGILVWQEGGEYVALLIAVAWSGSARSPAGWSAAQQQIADTLQHDAEVMSNTALENQLAGQPLDVRAEVVAINTTARPLALQVALLVPLIAGLLGLLNGFRMMRRPDPAPLEGAEMALV
jgi:hypothetical protein